MGKTTRLFRYDLNKIPYDYTVEMRNRFKGLDLLDRVPDELWSEVHDIVQETRSKTSSPLFDHDCARESCCQRKQMAWRGAMFWEALPI